MADPTAEQLADITWAIDSLKSRAEDYKLVSDYYDGRHRLDYVPRDLRPQFASLLRRLRVNLMPSVVSIVRDRLKLSTFTATAGDIKDPLADIWRANRLDLAAGQVHKEALKMGDAYLIVWPDAEDKPTLYPNDARNCTVMYDQERPGHVTKAAKLWEDDDGRVRVTLYYEDRLEKFRSRSKRVEGQGPPKDFETFTDEGESDYVITHDYGRVPVFHFANDAAPGRFGRSEFYDAIPIQDAINKVYRDKLVSSESQAMLQRYATGVEVVNDPVTGQPVNSWIPGDFWVTQDKDAKFGQLEAADLTPFVTVKDSYKEDLASVTGIPVFMFKPGSGTPPSGEALKVTMSRLTSKVWDRQVSFGAKWEEAVQFALKIARVEAELDAVWEETEPRDDKMVVENAAAAVEKLGGSKRQAWRERGFDDEEIDRIFKERKEEVAAEPPPPMVPPGSPEMDEARPS